MSVHCGGGGGGGGGVWSPSAAAGAAAAAAADGRVPPTVKYHDCINFISLEIFTTMCERTRGNRSLYDVVINFITGVKTVYAPRGVVARGRQVYLSEERRELF